MDSVPIPLGGRSVCSGKTLFPPGGDRMRAGQEHVPGGQGPSTRGEGSYLPAPETSHNFLLSFSLPCSSLPAEQRGNSEVGASVEPSPPGLTAIGMSLTFTLNEVGTTGKGKGLELERNMI